jgi:hypothetical protein
MGNCSLCQLRSLQRDMAKGKGAAVQTEMAQKLLLAAGTDPCTWSTKRLCHDFDPCIKTYTAVELERMTFQKL